MPKGTADFSRFETKKPADTMSITEESPSGSAMPKTQGDQLQGPAPPATEEVAKPDDKTRSEDPDTNMTDVGQEVEGTERSPGQPTTLLADQQPPTESTQQRPPSGWFGWLGRPATTEPASSAPVPAREPAQEEVAPPGEPEPPETKPSDEDQEMPPPQEPSATIDIPNQPPVQDKAVASSGSSWLWSWSGRGGPVHSQPVQGPPTAEPEPLPAVIPTAKEPDDVVMQDAPAAEIVPETPTPAPKAGSTWAFWSRDAGSAPTKKPVQQGEQGQLAVMGETSETHPRRANSMEFKRNPAKEPPLKSSQKDEPVKAVKTPSRESSSKSNKRVRPQSMDVDDMALVRPSTPKLDAAAKLAVPPTPIPKTPTSASSTKALPPNLLLPSFSSTYKLKENPSIIKQIAQLLLRTQQPSANHVYLAKEAPKIKKAVAIGVHGFFPAHYIRTMIGQPTGTSIKFANHCAEAIRRWANSHGCEDCEIEKIALEGEGKIGERVENLWRLLLNWIELIRNADLILIACHSQGVPVSIMLLAKLIELGVVSSAKVGVCAMGKSLTWCFGL